MEYTFWQSLNHNEIQVLGINAGEDAQTAQQFVQSFGLTFPILLDQQNSVYSSYYVAGISPFPRDVIIDQQGIIRYLHSEYDPQYMYQILGDLLPTGIENPGANNPLPRLLELSVFPNPTNSSTRVRFRRPANAPAEFRLYDVRGTLVVSRKLEADGNLEVSFSLNLDGRASGIYLAEVRSAGIREVRRLILSR